MVAISKIVFAATAATGVIAAPASQQNGPMVQVQQIKAIPSQWAVQGPADKTTMIKGQIGLKQNNIKGLQEKLADIANPASPNYGKWLSKEEVAKYTEPNAAHVAAVKAWLAENGINEVSQPTNDWIEFTVPVSTMEKMLDAKYEWFTHAKTGDKIPRTQAYSVPQGLVEAIDVVAPTTTFYTKIQPHMSSSSSKNGRRAAAAASYPPSKIKSLYNVDYTPVGSGLGATTGFLGVGASHDDFQSFTSQYASGTADFQDVDVNGGHNSGDGSQAEGNLDTQYMGALSAPLSTQYLATAPEGSDDSSFNDAMLGLTNYLQTTSTPPSVVSTSYGGEEDGVTADYLDRVCNEFMKVGSQGISVFFSSGDYGVGGNGEPSCSSGFYPTWPASCPYVTTIGGTDFDSTGNEVVADFSKYSKATSPGGGYSNHFSAPSYNKAVTTAYANGLSASTKSKVTNPNGRGYPDLALISVNYPIVVGGKNGAVLGTSASSPATAALFGLINDYRNSQGKPNLGFLNPTIYSSTVAPALRDVTSGSNKGCDSSGFPAKKGWDAASGLGSFDFAKLRQILSS